MDRAYRYAGMAESLQVFTEDLADLAVRLASYISPIYGRLPVATVPMNGNPDSEIEAVISWALGTGAMRISCAYPDGPGGRGEKLPVSSAVGHLRKILDGRDTELTVYRGFSLGRAVFLLEASQPDGGYAARMVIRPAQGEAPNTPESVYHGSFSLYE